MYITRQNTERGWEIPRKHTTSICKNILLFSGDEGRFSRKESFVRGCKEWSLKDGYNVSVQVNRYLLSPYCVAGPIIGSGDLLMEVCTEAVGMGMENGERQIKPAIQHCSGFQTALGISDIPLPLKSSQALPLIPITSCLFYVSDPPFRIQLLVLPYSQDSLALGWPLAPTLSHIQTLPSPCSSQEAADSRSCHHSFRLQHNSSMKRKLDTVC